MGGPVGKLRAIWRHEHDLRLHARRRFLHGTNQLLQNLLQRFSGNELCQGMSLAAQQ